MGTAIPRIGQTRHIFQSIRILVPLIILSIGIIVGVLNIKTIRTLLIGAAGEKANIKIDTQAVLGPMPRPWRNLAQGGEDHNWTIQPITGAVKALNPEYIRIDHVYDFFEIVSRDGDPLNFHWEKFDKILNEITATGAKPYISLSYTPPALAKDGDITAPPTNWGEYQLVIQKTIEHVSKDRGISDVIYEVWNEPDLFGKWKMYGDRNYLTLYSYANKGANAAVRNGAKPFKFGGPAITAWYKNWAETMLKAAARGEIRLDFFSWHRYAKEIDTFREDFQNMQEIAAKYPQLTNLEFHITEWGHDSNNNGGYDTGFSAAHTAAVATEMVGNLDRGFVFEIQDGKGPENKEFWGRWGLLTHPDFGSKPKPRYNALKLIDQIGSQRLQLLGKGSWVKGMAAKDGNAVTVVLANYDPSGAHGETVPVTFTSLTSSSFTLEQRYLDGTRKNEKIATTEAQLQVTVPMLPNSVVFMKLTPDVSAEIVPQYENAGPLR